jgi:ABC-2 type transport system permease protein
MWYEIFKFELKYRLRRPETYLFFFFLLVFSVFGVDFILQGVEIGLVKKNAPLVIGKTMGAITGIFMILASMIMGMPMIRDDQYQITPLIYTTPIKKSDLLIGRFLGSFLILIIIFCGIPLGMMMGEFLPWHLDTEMLPFSFTTYFTIFPSIVLPTLFFGAALFFVTGTLSRKLLVVYTQGIILFVVFLLTKAITNDYLQAVLDPFSLTTITQLSKDWTVAEKNALLLPFSGILMVNKMFWIGLGILVMWIGYFRFNFSTPRESRKSSRSKVNFEPINKILDIDLPNATPQYGWQSKVIQFFTMSIFYSKSLLKETSFWAIVICGVIIIIVNSISLGTVYGVDSYPTTYFIVEELQEQSLYFFIIILLFYSGELYWKEHSVGLNLMSDVTPISSFVSLSSKMTALIGAYIILMLSLILSGIAFQMMKGYYHFDLPVYFSGFFIEILPFLVVYTFAAFFIQSLVNSKFLGILVTLIFFIVMIALDSLGFNHVLFNFGGGALKAYSEMNGYGHFMTPYLWTKFYWVIFGTLALIIASLISGRGVDVKMIHRLKKVRSRLSKKTKIFASFILLLFMLVGSYVFYQTNVLNEVWTAEEAQSYRADYEKTLKQFEYQPQLKITAANLQVELYPDERSYDLVGKYTLKNEEASPISEIHIQKLIESDITLDSVSFSAPVTIDSQYQAFEYIIYKLSTPLKSGDSLIMHFEQVLRPKGFNTSGAVSSVLHNGTFIRNNEFPTLGYNKKYELGDESERKIYALAPRPIKAEIDDINELQVARSGSDSYGVRTNIIIGTNIDQTAVTSGNLIRTWEKENRNYFEYHSNGPMINFYAILSGRYELRQDQWHPKNQADQAPVDLEIYYHPRHTYNLDRMMNGMKASLAYYSSNFSPYPDQQLRIVEFPRYEDFAQSFPNTIPFSESIGFLLDIDDSTDVDMTFFVTAHEVAHQWWGLQVETANVKGRSFVLETLSQYSALMVFKNQFSQVKVDKLIAHQQDLYDKGKGKAKIEEVPLYLVGNEEYIYYNKGIIAMYNLQKYIGEDKVNQALRSFIKDWNNRNGEIKCKTDRYATSEDLISYILENTPEQKIDKVLKLFKEIY